MAERRGFSKRIVTSGRFMKMPVSSQVLYYHLGMEADDDGIVEAHSLMNMFPKDDLRILVSRGFVEVLNEELTTRIVDWEENNGISSGENGGK